MGSRDADPFHVELDPMSMTLGEYRAHAATEIAPVDPVPTPAATRGGDRMKAEPWRAHAACRGYRTNLWFPPEVPLTTGQGRRLKKRRAPLELDPIVIDKCYSCPVADDCLDYALHHNVEGIWAGTTQHERIHLRDLLGITAREVVYEIAPPPESSDHLSEEEAS